MKVKNIVVFYINSGILILKLKIEVTFKANLCTIYIYYTFKAHNIITVLIEQKYPQFNLDVRNKQTCLQWSRCRIFHTI